MGGGRWARVLTLPWTRDDADAQHRGVLALQRGNGGNGEGGKDDRQLGRRDCRCAVCCVLCIRHFTRGNFAPQRSEDLASSCIGRELLYHENCFTFADAPRPDHNLSISCALSSRLKCANPDSSPPLGLHWPTFAAPSMGHVAQHIVTEISIRSRPVSGAIGNMHWHHAHRVGLDVRQGHVHELPRPSRVRAIHDARFHPRHATRCM